MKRRPHKILNRTVHILNDVINKDINGLCVSCYRKVEMQEIITSIHKTRPYCGFFFGSNATMISLNNKYIPFLS